MDPQLRSKLLLAEPGHNAQKTQDAGVRGHKVKNLQSFSKLRSGVRSQLGKEEGRFSSFHSLVIHLANNYSTEYSFML
jgi:hypothetical protein